MIIENRIRKQSKECIMRRLNECNYKEIIKIYDNYG